MATIQMKWHNLNLSCRVVINSGTALLLYLMAFFGLTWMAQHHEAIERIYGLALGGLTFAFGSFLVRRTASDKTETAANIEKLKMGAAATIKPGEGDAEAK